MDRTTLELLIQIKADNLEALNDIRQKIDKVTAALDVNTTAQATNAAAVSTNAAAGAGAGLALGTLFLPAILGITAALGPFVVAVGAASVVLIGFGVGLTSLVLLVATANAAIGVLGATMFMLSVVAFPQFVTVWQQLKDAAKLAADTLAQAAVPAVSGMLDLLARAIPIIAAVATHMIGFFNDRLPSIMAYAWGVFSIFIDTIENVGVAFSHLADWVIKNMAPINREMWAFSMGAVAAFSSLIDTLIKVADWFMVRLPAAEPVLGSILGFLGRDVEFLAVQFGRLYDFVIKNWPAIIKTAQDWYTVIGQVVTAIGTYLVPGILFLVATARDQLGPIVADIVKHKQAWKTIAEAVGIVLVILAGFILLVVGAVLQIIDVVLKAIDGLQRFGDSLKGLQDPLIAFGNWIKQYIIQPIHDAWTMFGLVVQIVNGLANLLTGGPGASIKDFLQNFAVLKGFNVVGDPGNQSGVGGGNIGGHPSGPSPHGQVLSSGGATVLPVAFVTIPPSREQVAVMREHIRRLDREQR